MTGFSDKLPRIFCAIDTPDLNDAKNMITAIHDDCGVKLGLEFFNANGVSGVQNIMADFPETPLFLDLKYHDIPNTVAGAITAVTNTLHPAFLNVHATGGLTMMKAARQACPSETKLLAVTILTSLDSQELAAVGQGDDVQSQVVRLALLAKQAGLDGVVCSSHEIALLREKCGKDFILMVPGIRPEGSDMNDQKRVMTPKEAVNFGATHLVIGRPITKSSQPAVTARDILTSLTS